MAQRCLYGVDKNPMAVAIGRLALALATLVEGCEPAFVKHALKCGDGVVGLSDEQISKFHWGVKPKATPKANAGGADAR